MCEKPVMAFPKTNLPPSKYVPVSRRTPRALR